MIRFSQAAVAVFLTVMASQAAIAQEAGSNKPGEIKGVDALGDKSRSAQDGWVQAPIPREESASKDAPDPGGKSVKENAERPVPAADTSPTPGNDPQGPLEHRTPGPSGYNPASPSK